MVIGLTGACGNTKRMFSVAINQDLVLVNPVRKVKFYEEKPIKINILTQQEAAAMIKAAASHLKPLLGEAKT